MALLLAELGSAVAEFTDAEFDIFPSAVVTLFPMLVMFDSVVETLLVRLVRLVLRVFTFVVIEDVSKSGLKNLIFVLPGLSIDTVPAGKHLTLI